MKNIPEKNLLPFEKSTIWQKNIKKEMADNANLYDTECVEMINEIIDSLNSILLPDEIGNKILERMKQLNVGVSKEKMEKDKNHLMAIIMGLKSAKQSITTMLLALGSL